MKSLALLTTVSLIGLSTLATVRPVMALESRQPTETLITQANYKEAIAYFNRGVNYIQQEKYDLALAQFTRAIELDPNYTEAYFGRGMIYTIREQWRLAFQDLNTAIRLNPRAAYAYHFRGIVHLAFNQRQNAIADLTTAAELFRQQGNTEMYNSAIEALRQIGA
ncbi:MAG: tetratricopeptide repeat protein [Microcystis panniformis Mp_MB_F_20051200_S9]|uniref:Tetratricopeptide repeat protein n=1 Tax=Microcystis panniformis Mp_MB_F_20051200_S9 TaxID=2486223 RepID=A0A552Q2A6_9CHRO|nr:MAG: tetratricopeptide repeat protein [Microcystis panniformis Mp_MB_F_20080800_S26D]TRV48966.1 MAG: tetratricopeptide repeat protein [Microcystis panniformis Mp_GB_SS_20050300_S99D]TRV54378.1 MAG: tetratricopeptide repeat protein [Microcystis panniformis Mp_GB_SS_20050300_S99]TRV54523.1 MAG: tetratricopeptide repeat protein [Microcystis panniformis Mp_MB_F_20080800_S26]TRV63350.1 MAG: tetratricopeptide repeat protein [Microcystis panniformis Mp_MB_F_20051200_S9]TRV69543.1 MAG: tetratricope